MSSVRIAVMIGLVCATMCAWAQEPPIVNGNGETLKSLAGSDKLVTVVLRDSGAVDQNLKVVDVGITSFTLMTPEKERTAYLFSSVQEIRVQSGPVEGKKFRVEESRTLRVEEQRVVARGVERAAEFLGAQNVDQELKIQAARILAADNRGEGIDYLKKLMASNDLDTQLEAALALFATGNLEPNALLIAQGLQSGNRAVKAKAALLAGLLKDAGATETLLQMVQDRAAEISTPAARALGRMGNTDCIPTLLRMLLGRDPVKGDAAVFALQRIGGQTVVNQIKQALESAQGQPRFRIAVLLHRLEDPLGKKMLQEMNDFDAALVLGKSHDADSIQLLMTRLANRYDETTEKMIPRAKAAVTCIQGGDPMAVSRLQELLRPKNADVQVEICLLLTELGKRQMIPLLAPLIEKNVGIVAMASSTAAVAIARPTFREKLLETLDRNP